MPAITAAPSSATKNTSRFQLPMACSAGEARYSSPASAPSVSAASTTAFTGRRANCTSPLSAITAKPTGMASARTMPDQPSAGVSTKDWSSA